MAEVQESIETAAQPQSRLTFVHVATGMKVQFSDYFLTEFQDSVSTQYNKVSTFGRMDPIVNFQGAQRKISLGILVKPPDDGIKLASLHRKITRLQKMQYPVYESGDNALTIQRPPIVLARLANLIRGGDDKALLCAMEGFAFTPKAGFTPDSTPFMRFGAQTDNAQTAQGASSSDKFYFQEYTFKFDLTVLHRFPVGFSRADSVQSISDPDLQNYKVGTGVDDKVRFLGGYYFGSHTDETAKADVKVFNAAADPVKEDIQTLADAQNLLSQFDFSE